MSDKKVYIAKQQSGEAFKVGVSNDPQRRVNNISTSNPYDVELDMTIPSVVGDEAEQLETSIHALLRNYKLSGEWFEMDGYDFLLGYMCGKFFSPEEMAERGMI
jgi:hypothetical protein